MEKHYKTIFAAIILIKLLLSYFFPITADEAYYYTWGVNLDVNYYDHPPVIGWIIHAFSLIGRHIFWSRLFAVISGAAVALGIYYVANNFFQDKSKARLLSLVYLMTPLHVLFILISTDTALFLFSFLAGVLFFCGINRDKTPLIILSGLFLSLAVLSKYFAGFLLIAFLGYLVLNWSGRTLKNGLLLFAGFTPLILLHIYWNYNDCWITFMFNVFNRNQEHSLGLKTFFLYLGYQLYLATPWILYYLVKNYRAIKQGIKQDNYLFFHLAIIPLILLGLMSFFDTSLHWTISFYPFLFLLLVYASADQLRKIVWITAIFSFLHVAPIAVIMMLPIETFKNNRYYHDIVMASKGGEIFERLESLADDRVYGTLGYSTSALMTYYSNKWFIVFDDDDPNGRNDDKITNFKNLDGEDFLLLATLKLKNSDLSDFDTYFKSYTLETLNVRGAKYTLIFGNKFNYEAYRKKYLKKMLHSFYDIPSFLPIGECFFYKWYFPEKIR